MDDDKPEQLGSAQDTAIRARALETAFIALARCLQRDRPGLLQRAAAEILSMHAAVPDGSDEPLHEEAARFSHAEQILKAALAQAEGEG